MKKEKILPRFMGAILMIAFLFSTGKINAQCPIFNDCFSLVSSDGCTHVFSIDVVGDAIFTNQTNTTNFVNWNFNVLGDGVITSSYFVNPSGALAQTETTITNTDNSVTVNYFNCAPIPTFLFAGSHFEFVVEADAGSCFTVNRSGINGIFTFGSGVCDVNGACASLEVCSSGEDVSGTITAPGFYDCPGTQNHGIEGAEVSITTQSGESCQTTTDNAGLYDGCLFCDEGPYEVCVTSVCEDPCGVTDFDLVILREYILGIRKWTKEMAFIGDVTGNGTLSTIDLVRIQRDILGLDTETIENWCRFVPVNDYAAVPDPNTSGAETAYAAVDNCLTLATANSFSSDFVRFMLGDIDGSCSDCIHGDDIGSIPLLPELTADKFIVKSPVTDLIHAFTLHLEIPAGVKVEKVETVLPDLEYNIIGNELHIIWIDITDKNKGFKATMDKELITVKVSGGNLEMGKEENYILTSTGTSELIKREEAGDGRNIEMVNTTDEFHTQSILINDKTSIRIPQIKEKGTLTIYALDRRKLYSQFANSQTSFINVILNTGIYILTVDDADGTKSSKIFIP